MRPADHPAAIGISCSFIDTLPARKSYAGHFAFLTNSSKKRADLSMKATQASPTKE